MTEAEEFKSLITLFYSSTAGAAKSLGRTQSVLKNLESGRTKMDIHLLKFLRLKQKAGDHLRPADAPQPVATSDHVKMFRKHFGLTQEQAAYHLGVGRVTLNRWERGVTPCPNHLLTTLRGAVVKLKEEI